MRLPNKVVIITGGAAGIGRASAILFAAEGSKVVVVDCAANEGEEVVRIIRKKGRKSIFIKADVSKSTEVENMVRETIKIFGKIDILFNNAGTVIGGTIAEVKEEDWDKVIDVNLKSVYLGCKYVIPQMIKRGGGIIINTASVSGMKGLKNRSVYCASKGGIIALSKAIALDHAQDNIRVNCICPGTVDTPSLRQRVEQSKDPEAARKEFINRQPLGRLGKPEEVAHAALYLASDEASFITGSCLVIDGGLST